MAEAGLYFRADGSTEYLKMLKKLEDFSTRFDKALVSIASSSGKAEKSMESFFASADKGADSLEHLLSVTEKLESQVTKSMSSITGDMEKGFGDIESIAKRTEKSLETTLSSSNLRGMGERSAHSFATGFGGIVGESGSILSNLNRTIRTQIGAIENELRSAGQRLSSSGQSMIGAGVRGIGIGGAIAAGTLGGVALVSQPAIEFEQTMTNVQAILQASNQEMGVLNEQVLTLGANSTVGAQAAAQAYLEIVGGIQDEATQLEVLEQAIRGAEAGQADLAAITSGMISVLNSYGIENISAARTNDIFSRTVQLGVGSANEFVSAMSPLAGLAAELDISFEELGTGMAFLTARGATTGMAATRLQAAMTAILKPNQDMSAALQEMGYESGQAAIEALGLAGTLQGLDDALNGNTSALATALGTTEALQAATGLLHEDYNAFATDFAAGITGATDAARAIQLDAAYADIAKAQSQLSALFIEIGSVFLPIIADLARGVSDVASGVRAWMQENPELAATLTRLTAVGGLLLGGIIALGGALSVLGGLASLGLGAVLTGAASLVGLIMSPVGLVAGLGLVTAFFFDMADGAESALNPIQALFGFIESSLANISNGIATLQGFIGFAMGTDLAPSGDNSSLQERTRLQGEQARIQARILEQQAKINALSKESVTHTIEQGDTLWDLAQRYGVTVDELRAANDIQGSLIITGQELVIPVRAQTEQLELATLELEQLEMRAASAADELETLATTPVSPSGLTDTKDRLGDIRTSVSEILSGFQLLTSGDISGGFSAISSGIDGVWLAVQNLWNEFSMQGQPLVSATGDTGRENPILTRLRAFFDPILAYLEPFTSVAGTVFTEALATIDHLIKGVQGFFTNLTSGVDGAQLLEASQNIASAIGNILAVLATATVIIGKGVIDGLADALPRLGTAFANFVNAFSALATGDIGEFITELWTGINNLDDSLADFAIGTLDSIISSITRLLGTGDVSSFEQGFDIYVQALNDAWTAIQAIADNIARGFDTWLLNLQLRLYQFIDDTSAALPAELRDMIFSGAQSREVEISTRLTGMNVSDAVSTELRSQLETGGGINLSAPISFEVDGITTTMAVGEALGQQASGLVDTSYSFAGQAAVEDAITNSIATGNATALQLLIPVTANPDIQIAAVEGMVSEAINTEDSAAFNHLLPLAESIGVDTSYLEIAASEAGIAIGDSFASGIEPELTGIRDSVYLVGDSFTSISSGAQLAADSSAPYLNNIQGGFDRIATNANRLLSSLIGINAQMQAAGISPTNTQAITGSGTFGGGVASGGSLSAGQFYEIGENANDEAVTLGGRTYVFAANDGYVQPLGQSGVVSAGMGNSSVNSSQVINYGGVYVNVPASAGSPQDVKRAVMEALQEAQDDNRPDTTFRDTF